VSKLNVKNLCEEEVFVKRISDILFNKLRSGKTVKWNADFRIDIIKRAYGLCGVPSESCCKIGLDLGLSSNYVLSMLNRTQKIIEGFVVDRACSSNESYEESIAKIFKREEEVSGG
jgi:hypothetical protein